jgi:hypothetical protein
VHNLSNGKDMGNFSYMAGRNRTPNHLLGTEGGEPQTEVQKAHLTPISQKNECLSQRLAQARVQNPSVGVQQLDQLLAEGCGFLRVTRGHLHAQGNQILNPTTPFISPWLPPTL